VFLAGSKYREFLIPKLYERGFKVSVPMKGLHFGEQLHWLDIQLHAIAQDDPLEQLYRFIVRLENGIEGKRIFGQCSGRMDWLLRGLYILFETGENRSVKRNIMRIVRVGTHAVNSRSKSTLWTRLRAHRGPKQGGGNHRGSVFRLHVGNAILHRENLNSRYPTWGQGKTASKQIRESEAWIERKVSQAIGRMSVLWLDIADEPSPTSDRAFVEQNLIALLSSKGRLIDQPSVDWLGFSSPKQEIRDSGLWNLHYLDYDCHPSFMEVFEEYVELTIGSRTFSSNSIAPPGWWTLQKRS